MSFQTQDFRFPDSERRLNYSPLSASIAVEAVCGGPADGPLSKDGDSSPRTDLCPSAAGLDLSVSYSRFASLRLKKKKTEKKKKERERERQSVYSSKVAGYYQLPKNLLFFWGGAHAVVEASPP